MTPEIGLLKSSFLNLFEPSDSAEVLALAGELSTRKYFRIFVNKPSDDPTPPSYVLQAAEAFENPQRHPFLIAQQIFTALGVKVPKIFGVAGKEGWIVVEDCGDFFLQFRQEFGLYRQAIAMLVQLQKAQGPRDIRLDKSLRSAPHWSWAFDFEKLNAEMIHTENFFFRGLLGDNFPIAGLLKANNEYLAARPRILCHRDFHSRNLLIKEDQVYAIDFQDARMGPVSYDLVSLIWDPYANLNKKFQSQLLQEWRGQTGELALAGIEEEIERMKIQRLLKAIGSYSSFYLDRGNPSCFPYIEIALADVLESFAWLDQQGKLSGDERRVAMRLDIHLKKIRSSC